MANRWWAGNVSIGGGGGHVDSISLTPSSLHLRNTEEQLDDQNNTTTPTNGSTSPLKQNKKHHEDDRRKGIAHFDGSKRGLQREAQILAAATTEPRLQMTEPWRYYR